MPVQQVNQRVVRFYPICTSKAQIFQHLFFFLNCLLGVFQCGPASVKAVKNGEVYLPYDTSFVFAEVNGDLIYWEVKADGSMKKTYQYKDHIGTSISTKAVGAESREDVTREYKHPEGQSVCVVCLNFSVMCL